MTAMSKETPTLTGKELVAFPRPVAKVIIEAVNAHQVRYRLQDGTHIRLYCGDREVIPIKISASRPAQHTMRYLIPWLERNIPTWTQGEVTQEKVETLASLVNSQPRPKRKVVSKPVVETPVEDLKFEGDPEPDLPFPQEWVPYKKNPLFETNGTAYRCTHPGCDYYREGDARGMHLHTHDEQLKSQRHSQIAESRIVRNQQRKIMRQEAVRVLAEQNGLAVIDKDELAELRAAAAGSGKAKIEALRAERDDLKARIELLREAMNA